MLTSAVLVTLIENVTYVLLGLIAYAKIRAGQRETKAAVDDNTEKTVEVGVAVNGRVETLVQEKANAIEQVYKTKIDVLEAHVLSLQTALDVATKSAKELAEVREKNRATILKISEPKDGKQP